MLLLMFTVSSQRTTHPLKEEDTKLTDLCRCCQDQSSSPAVQRAEASVAGRQRKPAAKRQC